MRGILRKNESKGNLKKQEKVGKSRFRLCWLHRPAANPETRKTTTRKEHAVHSVIILTYLFQKKGSPCPSSFIEDYMRGVYAILFQSQKVRISCCFPFIKFGANWSILGWLVPMFLTSGDLCSGVSEDVFYCVREEFLSFSVLLCIAWFCEAKYFSPPTLVISVLIETLT